MGDVLQYTDEIAFLVFSSLESTAREFRQLFVDSSDFSGEYGRSACFVFVYVRELVSVVMHAIC